MQEMWRGSRISYSGGVTGGTGTRVAPYSGAHQGKGFSREAMEASAEA